MGTGQSSYHATHGRPHREVVAPALRTVLRQSAAVSLRADAAVRGRQEEGVLAGRSLKNGLRHAEQIQDRTRNQSLSVYEVKVHLVRAPAYHAGGRGFESRRSCHSTRKAVLGATTPGSFGLSDYVRFADQQARMRRLATGPGSTVALVANESINQHFKSP